MISLLRQRWWCRISPRISPVDPHNVLRLERCLERSKFPCKNNLENFHQLHSEKSRPPRDTFAPLEFLLPHMWWQKQRGLRLVTVQWFLELTSLGDFSLFKSTHFRQYFLLLSTDLSSHKLPMGGLLRPDSPMAEAVGARALLECRWVGWEDTERQLIVFKSLGNVYELCMNWKSNDCNCFDFDR